jgi:nucleoside 2-deoxyribosyltransferase
MRRGTCYLAGPITHAGSFEGAANWRETVAQWLEDMDIHAFSPMRGKAFLKDNWNLKEDGSFDNILSSPKAIVGRDHFDVRRTDVMLVNLLGSEKASIGTCIEYGWAHERGTPIVTVVAEGNIHRHAMLMEMSTYVTTDLEEGVALVDTLIG